ncbi:MAG: hypothetical protein GY745_03900 [Actinomycetia bacterium]|nr:hypothetical protein [Actinomycetes bacterium]
MDLVSRLRARGVRMTRQRVQVADVLAELGGYPSVREVVEALHECENQISSATVYNSLQAFTATGEVIQLMGNGDLMRFGTSGSGMTSIYVCEKGYLLDPQTALGKPIERVHITYVVGRPPPQNCVAPESGEELPEDCSDEPAAVSRSTDPVYRPRPSP